MQATITSKKFAIKIPHDNSQLEGGAQHALMIAVGVLAEKYIRAGGNEGGR